MNIDFFQIDIIDTQENNRSLIDENVSVESPRLVYNGSDDRFQNLMTSELHFSMQVLDNVDGKFFHLFTGAETRYKVLLQDVSDQNDIKIIWQGFLLPEQFQEAYKSAPLFVDFIATDGVGRIKSYSLSSVYYEGNYSVLEYLNQCLLKTGLSLPINFSPEVISPLFDLDYLDLEINGVSYADSDKKKSSYDILTAILESIGCKLFQFNNEWWVLGLSRFSEEEIPCKKYINDALSGLQYSSSFTYVREKFNYYFESSPTVDVLPLLNEMEVSFNPENREHIVAEDLVNHFPKNYSESNTADRTPKYWKLVTNKPNVSLAVFLLFQFDVSGGFNRFYNNYISVPTNKVMFGPWINIISSLNNNTASEVQLADIDSNYIDLIDPFYLDGSAENTVNLTLELSAGGAISVSQTDLKAAIDNDEFLNHFKFAVTYKQNKLSPLVDEEIVLSNFHTGTDLDKEFDFDLSVSSETTEIVGRLNIKDIIFKKPGYYNLRLYPVVYNVKLGSNIFYKQADFTITTLKKVIDSLGKETDFSTKQELEVYHASSEMKLSDKQFNLSNSIQIKLDNNTLFNNEVLVNQRFYNKQVNGVIGFDYKIGLEDVDFSRFIGGYKFYVKKAGSLVLEKLLEASYQVVDTEQFGKVFSQIEFLVPVPGYYFVKAEDELYLKIDSDFDELKYKEHLSNRFSRYFGGDSLSFSNCLMLSYLGLVSSAKIRVVGKAFGLVSPLELIWFKYSGLNLYSSTSLDLDLVSGLTELTMIQAARDVITSTVVEFPISIFISNVSSVEDGNWKLSLDYTIDNASVINAEVKARHFSGDLNNIGSASGYEMVGSISNESGSYTFDFPSVIPEVNRGLYQVSVTQSGVVSNLVYVEVFPVVVIVTPEPSIYVTVSSDPSDTTTGSPVSRDVDYKFTAFTPTTAVFKCQKIDFTTKAPIGNQTVINITVFTPEVTHTLTNVSFPEGIGFYKLELLTNEINWELETFIS